MTFETHRQVTDIYNTPAGHEYTFVHDAELLLQNEHSPSGFTPLTADILISQEQQIIDSALTPEQARKKYYPIAAASGLIAGLVTNLVNERQGTPYSIFAGLFTAAVSVATIEYTGVYISKENTTRAQARIADIKANTIAD